MPPCLCSSVQKLMLSKNNTSGSYASSQLLLRRRLFDIKTHFEICQEGGMMRAWTGTSPLSPCNQSYHLQKFGVCNDRGRIWRLPAPKWWTELFFLLQFQQISTEIPMVHDWNCSKIKALGKYFHRSSVFFVSKLGSIPQKVTSATSLEANTMKAFLCNCFMGQRATRVMSKDDME